MVGAQKESKDLNSISGNVVFPLAKSRTGGESRKQTNKKNKFSADIQEKKHSFIPDITNITN